MLANFHTHTTFCDGKNTPEEIVIEAINRGFSSLGFSGHGYTDFDLRYCMKDVDLYINEINRLKEKYKKEIQIYCGVEEDAFSPVDRERFDYIIGSEHYLYVNGKYYPIDSSLDCFKKCLDIFEGDIIRLSEAYYNSFCDYVIKRKPDIIGHFDLITKFDEVNSLCFSKNEEYNNVAERYITAAVKADCIFEVNTGAISRGFRTTPYPNENLLFLLKKYNSKVILSSDSHSKETLDFDFQNVKKYLFDIGFRYIYTFYDNEFRKELI